MPPGRLASMRPGLPPCSKFLGQSTGIPISSATLFRGLRPFAPPWEKSEWPIPSPGRACTSGRQPLGVSSKKKESRIQEMMKALSAMWLRQDIPITSGIWTSRWYQRPLDSGRRGLRFRFRRSGRSAGGWGSFWITAPGVSWEPVYSKKTPPPLQCNPF